MCNKIKGYYPLHIVAVYAQPRLAGGQKIFDIFWRRSKLHNRVKCFVIPLSALHPAFFLPRRRPYQAAIIYFCNLMSLFSL